MSEARSRALAFASERSNAALDRQTHSMAVRDLTVSTQFSLDRGERQLWSGVPRQGLVLRATDAFLIPFSLLWAGFAVFWEAAVIRDGAPFFFRLWGIPFVLVGLYITIGRFFLDARRRANTSYAVTSERVLIKSGVLSTQLKSLSLQNLSDVTLHSRPNGSGTITFGPSMPGAAMMRGMAWPGVPQPPMFEEIADAKRVYDIVRDAQRATRAAV